MPRVVVIGAGAAGLMASIFAAADGGDTTLLERTRDGGRKILISGGGRCNILPAELDASRFVTDSSPNTLRKIVRSWPLREQVAFFERGLNLPLVEEVESRKLFPQSQRARDVRDVLMEHARGKGVAIVTNSFVTDVTSDADRWQVQREGAEPIACDAVILATGGLSVPTTGSDGHGLEIARRLGHSVHATYPALTPLLNEKSGSGVIFGNDRAKITPDPDFSSLAGISLPVTLTARSAARESRTTGGFLFTHRGYSGPAVLDVSHVPVRSRIETGPQADVIVQWTPLKDSDWEDVLRPRNAGTVVAALDSHLPHRLAEALLARADVEPGKLLSQLHRTERLRLIEMLVRSRLPWDGDEGYKKAEVTGGGVPLSEIDPKTMESRKRKGLFLCGEILDAFGPIGGYNFLWAWVTGRAAGSAAARVI